MAIYVTQHKNGQVSIRGVESVYTRDSALTFIEKAMEYRAVQNIYLEPDREIDVQQFTDFISDVRLRVPNIQMIVATQRALGETKGHCVSP